MAKTYRINGKNILIIMYVVKQKLVDWLIWKLVRCFNLNINTYEKNERGIPIQIGIVL